MRSLNKHIFGFVVLTSITTITCKTNAEVIDKSTEHKSCCSTNATYNLLLSKNTKTTAQLDKSKLTELINKSNDILKNIIIGEEDGMTKQSFVDEFKTELNRAKEVEASNSTSQIEIDSTAASLELAIVKLQESENASYLEDMKSFKGEIDACIILYNEATPGNSIDDYPKEAIEEFKKAIDEAEEVLESNSKSKDTYRKAILALQKAKEKFQATKINASIISQYKSDLNKLLKEMSTLIKTTEVGSVNGGVSENQKIALSVMMAKINQMVSGVDDVDIINEAIVIAKNAISDFKDKSIYIDDKNIVNGKKLTGKISSISNKEPEAELITMKKEFIPQAGMCVDIKTTLYVLSALFLSAGAILNKKSKK